MLEIYWCGGEDGRGWDCPSLRMGSLLRVLLPHLQALQGRHLGGLSQEVESGAVSGEGAACLEAS